MLTDQRPPLVGSSENQALQQVESSGQQEPQEKWYSKPVVLVIGAILLFGAITGTVYAISQMFIHTQTPPKTDIEILPIESEVSSPTPTPVMENEPSDEAMMEKTEETIVLQSLDDTSKNDRFRAFYDKLPGCEEYKLKYSFVDVEGQQFEKTIAGMQEGQCYFYETLPNGGRMDCNLTQTQLVAFSEFFKKSLDASSTEFSMSAKLSPEESESTFESQVMYDGVETEDVYNKALQDGSCVISGY